MTTWANTSDMVQLMIDTIGEEYPQVYGLINNPNIREKLQGALDLMYDLVLARKQSMVWDKIVQAAITGTYGDIGPEGARTDLGTIVDDFKAAYSPGFLDCFDEDGNFIC